MGPNDTLIPDQRTFQALSAVIMRSGLAFVVIRLDGAAERYVVRGGQPIRVS